MKLYKFPAILLDQLVPSLLKEPEFQKIALKILKVKCESLQRKTPNGEGLQIHSLNCVIQLIQVSNIFNVF